MGCKEVRCWPGTRLNVLLLVTLASNLPRLVTAVKFSKAV